MNQLTRQYEETEFHSEPGEKLTDLMRAVADDIDARGAGVLVSVEFTFGTHAAHAHTKWRMSGRDIADKSGFWHEAEREQQTPVLDRFIEYGDID